LCACFALEGLPPLIFFTHCLIYPPPNSLDTNKTLCFEMWPTKKHTTKTRARTYRVQRRWIWWITATHPRYNKITPRYCLGFVVSTKLVIICQISAKLARLSAFLASGDTLCHSCARVRVWPIFSASLKVQHFAQNLSCTILGFPKGRC